MQPRKLGFFDITMIVVSLVIGMGIFRTPVNVAKAAITPEIYYAAWFIGGLVALCGALTFAEIGSRLPVSGGYYRIFSFCYHPSFAFMLNATILVSNAASVAGVALIGSEYISGVFFSPNDPDLQIERVFIAAGEIILFYALNLLGLKTSARTQNVLTLFKIGIVLLLGIAVFSPSKEFVNPDILAHPPAEHGWTAVLISLGICLIPVSFTYGGYQQTINFGSDIHNAHRVMPRGIILGIAIVVLLYMMINYTYMNIIQFENLGHAKNIASTLAGKILGGTGQQIFTLVFFLAVLAYVNVGLMSNPRVIVAMSEEKVLPAVFTRSSKRFHVPVIALTIFTAICLIVLLFASTFDKIVNYVIFLDSLGLVAAASTIFILRNRGVGNDLQPYKMKLFPVATIFFMLAYAFVTFSVIYDKPKSALYGLIMFISFLPLYFIFRYFSRKKNA